MVSNPKISVILLTVIYDRYSEYQKYKYLEKVIDDFNNQTFKDFELIIVDGFYNYEDFELIIDDGLYDYKKINELPINFKFKIVESKHIEILSERKKDRLYFNVYKNTGLIYANGELCVEIEDCCKFQDDYLYTIWNEYEKNWSLCSSNIENSLMKENNHGK